MARGGLISSPPKNVSERTVLLVVSWQFGFLNEEGAQHAPQWTPVITDETDESLFGCCSGTPASYKPSNTDNQIRCSINQ